MIHTHIEHTVQSHSIFHFNWIQQNSARMKRRCRTRTSNDENDANAKCALRNQQLPLEI